MPRSLVVITASLVFSLACISPAAAQELGPAELLPELRGGGLVIVMRHGASPGQEPDAATANPDNPDHERQLDERGRMTTAAMGEALKTLAIPIGAVLASPTYRTRETASLLGFPAPQTFEELATAGGMTPDPAVMEERGAWLRDRTADAPAAGTNTLIISHSTNLTAAFGLADDPPEGSALIFRPDGAGSSGPVGRMDIEDWPALVAAQ